MFQGGVTRKDLVQRVVGSGLTQRRPIPAMVSIAKQRHLQAILSEVTLLQGLLLLHGGVEVVRTRLKMGFAKGCRGSAGGWE